MATWLTDDIDFSAYMESTEAEQRVISSGAYVEDVVDYFHSPETNHGLSIPFQKVAHLIHFRPGEVTLWSGINGHGKSMLMGQVMTGVVAAGQKVCVCSFEMKPVATLARMCRQASATNKPDMEFIRHFHRFTDNRLYMYDQQGTVKAKTILAVARYCADKLGIQHFVIDSLLKLGIREDDYTAQKDVLDELCTIARDTGMHIHLVAHSRKHEDESRVPRKMDIKGSGSIADQVDNILITWRNKPKEERLAAGNPVEASEPDALLICDKQRNGEWEGRVMLWFDRASWQYTESSFGHPLYLIGGWQ